MRAFPLFTAFGIPVAVHPFYLLLVYFLSRSFGGGDPQAALIWGAVITAAVLVHEFGHALVARAFGLGPSVMLAGWGGVTSHGRPRQRAQEALVVASGPAAGLLFGLLSLGALLLLREVAPRTLHTKPLVITFNALLMTNFGWSVLNLLPVWPLDGGHLLRLGLQRLFGPLRADRATHLTALLIAGAALWWMLSQDYRSPFNLIIVGLLAWQNYTALRGGTSSGTVHASHERGRELLQQARNALAADNPREAVRLCHQARADAHLSAEQLGQLWLLLGQAHADMDEPEQALDYLRRAPAGRETREVTRRCLVALGREQELQDYDTEQQRRTPRDPAGRWLWVVVGFDLIVMAGALLLYFSD